MRSPCWGWPGVTVRSSTVLSGFTTKTNGPLWLICTACDGTSVALLRMSKMKRTRTNSIGQSARSGFGVTPRAFTVPEPGCTALSMKYNSPMRGAMERSARYVSTFTFGPPRYFRTSGKSFSATVRPPTSARNFESVRNQPDTRRSDVRSSNRLADPPFPPYATSSWTVEVR